MSARVTYPTTRPRKHDTLWITKQKLLQVYNGAGLDGGVDQATVYPDTNVKFADTKKITLDKILQKRSP